MTSRRASYGGRMASGSVSADTDRTSLLAVNISRFQKNLRRSINRASIEMSHSPEAHEHLPNIDIKNQHLEEMTAILFTHDTVDVDKVLCLHLLAVQYIGNNLLDTELPNSKNVHSTTSTPGVRRSSTDYPSEPDERKARASIVSRKSRANPYEIRRSILVPHLTNLLSTAKDAISHVHNTDKTVEKLPEGHKGSSRKLLPSYVLFVNESDASGSKSQADAEFDMKILNIWEESRTEDVHLQLWVNLQIELIIDSILDILQKTSEEKFKLLVSKAGNPAEVQVLLATSAMQQFIRDLYGKTLVYGIHSFVECPGKVLAAKEPPTSNLSGDDDDVRVVNLLDTTAITVRPLLSDIRHGLLDELQSYALVSDEAGYKKRRRVTLVVAETDGASPPVTPDKSMGEAERDREETESRRTSESQGSDAPSRVTFRRIPRTRVIYSQNEVADIDPLISDDRGFVITAFSGFLRHHSKTSEISLSPDADSTPVSFCPEEPPKRKRYSTRMSVSINLQPDTDRKMSSALMSSITEVSDMSRQIVEYRNRIMTDDFLLERGLLDDLVKAYGNRLEEVAEEEKAEDVRLAMLTAEHQSNAKVRRLTLERENLEERFMNVLSVDQRSRIRKRQEEMEERDRDIGVKRHITFAAYGLPLLTVRDVRLAVSFFPAVEWEQLFLPARLGGLGLPLSCRPVHTLQEQEAMMTIEERNPTLTSFELEQLKNQIAGREIRRRIKLLCDKIPG